jgi:co-chaperonin GroES (HSP10)
MVFKLRPLGRRIYGILIPVGEKVTQGGLIITPAKHSELTRVGMVQEVGPDVTKVETGDKFLILFHAGSIIDSLEEYMSGDDTHRIIDESEILAIVD